MFYKSLFTFFLAFCLSQTAFASGKDQDKKRKFTECAAVELYTVSPKHANKGKPIEDTTKIPEGWTLVGAGGGGGHPTMMICR